MKFYAFDSIRAAADCATLATSLFGCVVHAGRTSAPWRNGKNQNSVSIEKDQWFDHGAPAGTIDGGDCLKLAMLKFGDLQTTQEKLGEMLGLTPKMTTGAQPNHETRYDELLRMGYIETRRDVYLSAEGTPVLYEVRLDHPDATNHKKQYLVGLAKDVKPCGIKDTPRVLFNLPGIIAADWCCIVEGPKCACVLIERGIPATTCIGGAKGWRSEYNDALHGKDIVIMPDNDAVGIERSHEIAAELYGKVKSIRIVKTSETLKGDVADYILKEGHTADDVLTLIAAAPAYRPATLALQEAVSLGPTPAALAEAKAANSVPFRNYIPGEKTTERRGKQVKEETKEPRTHAAMLDDLSRRFLGFPRKVGDRFLFDHDRDTCKIIEIKDSDDLLAWVSRRSKHQPSWARGDEMSTSKQFLSSVTAVAYRYEAVSLIPDWPRRPDVYYAHGPIPPPSPGHVVFNEFVGFFCPTTEHDRRLIAAFICAPLWFVPGIARPCWIVDSKDGPGSGKTKLVELVAQLYGNDPIRTSKQELGSNLQQLVKRCVSDAGRNARVLLVDNVKGDFDSSELSDLITARSISGMAPYGHGEETRPNNLTYTITVNTATVSTDLASRSFYISVNKPTEESMSAGWYSKVQRFIEKNQYQVVSDILDLLSNHHPFAMPVRTRFPEFEQTILQPCCGSPEATFETLDHIFGARAESNIEEELAHAIIEVFKFNLQQEGIDPDNTPVFLQTNVVNSWGRYAINEASSSIQDRNVIPVQVIRNLAKSKLIPQIEADQKRFPFSHHNRGTIFSGVAWNFSDSTESALVLTRQGGGGIEKRMVMG